MLNIQFLCKNITFIQQYKFNYKNIVWNEIQLLIVSYETSNQQFKLYKQAQSEFIDKPSNKMNKVIQNYVLLQKIGQGQYGNVYKSENKKSKQFFAVKAMNVQKFKSTPKLSQFTNNQITILSKINHPNIIKFMQMLRTSNNYYLVYQYCNGGTLAEHIKMKKRLTEDQAIRIFMQVRAAFEVLSAENILHRDLKPTNILFHNGVIKVADFGFCKELLKDTDMTQTMVGSPIYMAPEVLKGLIYDSRADIWSMGVILYQMLYGVCPYEQSSIPKLVSLIDNTMLKFPSSIKVSQPIKNLIKRMLTIKYRDRISPSQFLKYKLSQQATLSVSTSRNLQAVSFPFVCQFIRSSMLYLNSTIQLLIPSLDSLSYLRLCFLTYKILYSLIKETNKESSYWEIIKVKNNQEKWEYMYQGEIGLLKPFAQQLKEALIRIDTTMEMRIEMETHYLGPKYFVELIASLQQQQLKQRLYNCLLINKHFINVLQRKTPDFTDYTLPSCVKTYDDKIQMCKKFAKLY